MSLDYSSGEEAKGGGGCEHTAGNDWYLKFTWVFAPINSMYSWANAITMFVVSNKMREYHKWVLFLEGQRP